MKVYKKNIDTIVQTQYYDPLLNHLHEKVFFSIKNEKNQTLLDIGCGVGRVVLLAAKKGIYSVGVDIERKALEIARKNAQMLSLEKQCMFVLGDVVKNKKLSQRKFDIVVCSEVIEHVTNPDKIIDIAYKYLKDGGLFILTTPHDPKLWSSIDEFADHVKRYQVEEIECMLSKFKIVSLYTVGFPFMKSIILTYRFIRKVTHTSHTNTWRQKQQQNNIYKMVVGFLLKIDDLFNTFNHGTNIVAVAQK